MEKKEIDKLYEETGIFACVICVLCNYVVGLLVDRFVGLLVG